MPISELGTDLNSGDVPRFSYVIPDECHDMHGDPPYCLDSGNIGDPQNQRLVAVGDAYLGQLVSLITHSVTWAKGNNAIVVTFDNGDNAAGCCDAKPGGGRIPTIVITSRGPRHFVYSTPANHYSLLSTLEHLFGVGCLQHTCDSKNVHPIYPLFADTGSKPIVVKQLAERNWPTPTPSQPAEPRSMTKAKQGSEGWTVQRTQLLGTSDNSLGAIAGSSPSDVWAVGDYLPDTKTSNQDATLTFAEHFNGKQWTVVRTPNAGPNFSSFYGVAADRALVESWNGEKWSIDNVPQPGEARDLMFGASARSKSDVWVVGDQEGADGKFETLAEHRDGQTWKVVPTPNPGSSGNHLYAVDAVSRTDVWAVGQRLGSRAPDHGLIEHWNGRRWTVITLPGSTTSGVHRGSSPSASTVASVLLDAVVAKGTQVWVAGEADSPGSGGRPLIAHLARGRWTIAHLPASAGSNWTNLYGLALAGGEAWAAGTFVDPKTDNNDVLVLHSDGDRFHWTVNGPPDPGTGSNIPGGLTSIGGHLWLAGIYDDGGSELPLIEHR